MTKKIYSFNYDFYTAQLEFEVDLEKFTEEMARETLDFFSWDYDKEADPIDEVLKKYALEVLRVGGDSSDYQIIHSWNQEGFAPIDGSMGIKLTEYSGIDYQENDLEMEVKDVL
ncbi:DUF2528 family protein [Mongoliibacter ruber]|uniref:Uncharacterized protein DUF2528 n=1 Tax=Mongoliibacter ruber TaxID=1750599 RepID=A0A2T0WV92_9BACT|nr:DUF2528 family protein [Mongoliibacter ruber]PRY90612.1 uncharacterized protein DUF2528 [Mongoliibacter ruber]